MAHYGNPSDIPTSGSVRPNWAAFLNDVSHRGKYTYSAASANRVRTIFNDLTPYQISEGGGLLGIAPVELIQVALVATSTIRQFATIVSGDAWGRFVPTVDDVANEGCVISSQTVAPDPVDPGFGRRVFTPSIFASGPLNISRAVLQDSPRALETLTFTAGQRLGRVQNRAWTIGGFPGVPDGICQQATVGVTAASASDIAIDEVLQLIGSINAYYRPNAKLMMNTNTWTYLVQLKESIGDGLSGQYLWKLAGLDQFPIAFNDHMPDIAAGSTPIIYGDLSTFVIHEAGVISTQIMREVRAERYEDVLELFQPADGVLADAAGNAVAALQMAAS